MRNILNICFRVKINKMNKLYISIILLFIIRTLLHVCSASLDINSNEKYTNDKCLRLSWAKVIAKWIDHTIYITTDSYTSGYNVTIENQAKWPDDIQSCGSITEVPKFPNGEPRSFQRVENRIVYAFSSYYERRPLANGPSVRIIAGGFQEEFNDIGDMYCQLWYAHYSTPAVVKAKYEVIYRSIAHGDMWTAHFILCPLPATPNHDDLDTIPFAVSVTPLPCSKPTNQLLVLNREPPNPTLTFGICISAIYGRYSDWIGVSEMLEMWTILGANEIVLYNLSLSKETDLAISYYEKDPGKNITVIPWHLPSDMHKTSTFFQRGVFNDCLYRLSQKHRYVSMQDLDEVIVPRTTKYWKELFNILYTPNRAIYMFQHSYFRRNTTDEDPYTITQSSFWTTKEVMPPGKIRCKSIYNALLTHSVDIHYHYALLKGTEEYMVPPELAKLHHYRITPMETFRKDPTIEFIEDRYLEQYKNELITNVRKSISDIRKMM